MIRLVAVLSLALLITGCRHQPQQENKTAAVIINDKEIYQEEIDNAIDQQLYEILQRVYALRKNAADAIIEQYILEEEARKRNATKDEYLQAIIRNKITDSTLHQFIKDTRMDVVGIPVVSNTLRYVMPDTEEGRILARKRMEDLLTKRLMDSLKKTYVIKVNILPPSPPPVKLNEKELLVHYRGNLQSKVTFWEISDLECPNCHDAASLYKKIYEKFKDSIRFAFVHFSGTVTPAALAAEAAARQNKFWEMHDAIFGHPPAYRKQFFNYLADSLQLMKERFESDMQDTAIQAAITRNIRTLQEKKFYATPTVLINSRLILDPFSEEEIVQQIRKLLK